MIVVGVWFWKNIFETLLRCDCAEQSDRLSPTRRVEAADSEVGIRQWSRRWWGAGRDITCCCTWSLPACSAAMSHVTSPVLVFVPTRLWQVQTHFGCFWYPTSVQSLITLWVSNKPLSKTTGLTAAWQSVQTNRALSLFVCHKVKSKLSEAVYCAVKSGRGHHDCKMRI